MVGVTPLRLAPHSPDGGRIFALVAEHNGVAIRFYVYTPKRAVDAPDKKYLIYFL